MSEDRIEDVIEQEASIRQSQLCGDATHPEPMNADLVAKLWDQAQLLSAILKDLQTHIDHEVLQGNLVSQKNVNTANNNNPDHAYSLDPETDEDTILSIVLANHFHEVSTETIGHDGISTILLTYLYACLRMTGRMETRNTKDCIIGEILALTLLDGLIRTTPQRRVFITSKRLLEKCGKGKM